jgi:hypothetical protein
VQPNMMSMIRISSMVTWTLTFLITAGFDVAMLIVLNRPRVKMALADPNSPESPAMM